MRLHALDEQTHLRQGYGGQALVPPDGLRNSLPLFHDSNIPRLHLGIYFTNSLNTMIHGATTMNMQI
jgi:hypothetical protein